MIARRLAAVLVGLPILLCSDVAYAHVSVQPTEALAGSETTFLFRVPTERDDAATVKVVLVLPDDPPLASVSLEQVPGWPAQTTTRVLTRPVQTADGPVRTVVSRVTWTAAGRAEAIGPGEFRSFVILTGPLPAGRLVFKALQYYSDGTVVRWIDPTGSGAEPAHPAPVVRVVADPPAATRTSGGGGDDGWIAVAAFVAGLLGFAAGSAAFVIARRSAAGDRT